MPRRGAVSSTFLLQFALGLYLLALGLAGIVQYNSELNEFARAVSDFFGQSRGTMSIVVAIVELVAGIFLLAGLFSVFGSRVQFLAGFIILILWVLRILYFYVFNNFVEPNFFTWFSGFSRELVILASLWVITRRN